jgi:hypothetical protein
MTNLELEKQFYSKNPEMLKSAKKHLINIYGVLGFKEIKAFVKTNSNKKGIRFTKKQYKELVWKLTELQDLKSLPNYEKRGWKNYHLDHVFPICKCFKLGIPAEICSDLRNLRFIPYKDNLEKGVKITIKLFSLPD